MSDDALERLFPALTEGGFDITSPPDRRYNCIAWAAGDVTRWWWPAESPFAYWPAGMDREESLTSFIRAFATLGYEPASSGDPEPSFENVAARPPPALWARTEPPCSAANDFTMARPRPRPPYVRVADASAWRNASNAWGRKSRRMPTPRSLTIRCACSQLRVTSTRTVLPAGENLIAFDSRFHAICCRRVASPVTTAGCARSSTRTRFASAA